MTYTDFWNLYRISFTVLPKFINCHKLSELSPPEPLHVGDLKVDLRSIHFSFAIVSFCTFVLLHAKIFFVSSAFYTSISECHILDKSFRKKKKIVKGAALFWNIALIINPYTKFLNYSIFLSIRKCLLSADMDL